MMSVMRKPCPLTSVVQIKSRCTPLSEYLPMFTVRVSSIISRPFFLSFPSSSSDFCTHAVFESIYHRVSAVISPRRKVRYFFLPKGSLFVDYSLVSRYVFGLALS